MKNPQITYSGHKEGAGATAVIYRKGRNLLLRHLKAYLGPLTRHNTYEGEAVDGLLACWVIHNTIETSFKVVSLYINNQALIKASTRPGASLGQHLVQAFKETVNNLSAKITV